jgi:hypothetical protein
MSAPRSLWNSPGPAYDRSAMTSDTESLRILYQYKRLVLLGKLHPSMEEARRIVGPDCAFHLYFRLHDDSPRVKRRRAQTMQIRKRHARNSRARS